MKMLTVTIFLLSTLVKADAVELKTLSTAEFLNNHKMAEKYERGTDGVTQDFAEAVRWYCRNKVEGSTASNRSMLKLEKFAESDAEIKDPNEAATIYCDKKKEPKPSMEPYSPLRVSWCDMSNRAALKDCAWFTQKYDKYGQPLGAAAVAELALSELPPLSRSTDWYLDLVWKFGLYGGSISPLTTEKYQSNFIIEDPNQRPYLFLEIKSKYLKLNKDGYSYDDPTNDRRIKLQLKVKNKALKECLDRSGKHYDDNVILGTYEPTKNPKAGKLFNVVLLKRCFGTR